LSGAKSLKNKALSAVVEALATTETTARLKIEAKL